LSDINVPSKVDVKISYAGNIWRSGWNTNTKTLN